MFKLAEPADRQACCSEASDVPAPHIEPLPFPQISRAEFAFDFWTEVEVGSREIEERFQYIDSGVEKSNTHLPVARLFEKHRIDDEDDDSTIPFPGPLRIPKARVDANDRLRHEQRRSQVSVPAEAPQQESTWMCRSNGSRPESSSEIRSGTETISVTATAESEVQHRGEVAEPRSRVGHEQPAAASRTLLRRMTSKRASLGAAVQENTIGRQASKKQRMLWSDLAVSWNVPLLVRWCGAHGQTLINHQVETLERPVRK